jgi:hypothetical protein
MKLGLGMQGSPPLNAFLAGAFSLCKFNPSDLSLKHGIWNVALLIEYMLMAVLAGVLIEGSDTTY